MSRAPVRAAARGRGRARQPRAAAARAVRGGPAREARVVRGAARAARVSRNPRPRPSAGPSRTPSPPGRASSSSPERTRSTRWIPCSRRSSGSAAGSCGTACRRTRGASCGSLAWAPCRCIGMPGCGMFSQATLFDLLLPRLLAGETRGPGGARGIRPRGPPRARDGVPVSALPGRPRARDAAGIAVVGIIQFTRDRCAKLSAVLDGIGFSRREGVRDGSALRRRDPRAVPAPSPLRGAARSRRVSRGREPSLRRPPARRAALRRGPGHRGGPLPGGCLRHRDGLGRSPGRDGRGPLGGGARSGSSATRCSRPSALRSGRRAWRASPCRWPCCAGPSAPAPRGSPRSVAGTRLRGAPGPPGVAGERR